MSNDTMKYLFIEPLDVWLFRNGRPFNKGEDHTAQGIFPPMPSTMQGVLRTHHLALNRVYVYDAEEIREHVGTRYDYPSDFQVAGPFLARKQNGRIARYFPMPQDLYLEAERDVYRTFKLETKQQFPIYTDLRSHDDPEAAHLQLLHRHTSQEPQKEEIEGGAWISETGMATYLHNQQLPKDAVIKGSDLFATEARTGIALNDAQRTTKEGLLYEVKFMRLKENVGLAVGLAGLEGWPDEGVIAIGGEARAGYYRNCSGWLPMHTLAANADVTQFKLVFLTPTYFAKGWRSENWSQFFVNDVELVATALGRPLIWGGRDLAQNKHEPSYRYVPAGSVYYFKGQPALKLPYITDKPDQLGPIGFGQFAIGGW